MDGERESSKYMLLVCLDDDDKFLNNILGQSFFSWKMKLWDLLNIGKCSDVSVK